MNFFNSFGEFSKVYEDIWDYYLDTIKELTEILNEYHQVEYSKKYWEIIIGKWVWGYIVFLHARYRISYNGQGINNAVINKLPLMSENVDMRSIGYDEKWNQYLINYICMRRNEYSIRECKDRSVDSNEIRQKIHKKVFDISSFKKKKAIVQDVYKFLLDEESTFIFTKLLKINGLETLQAVKFNYENKTVNFHERKKIFKKEKWINEFDYVFWSSLVDHFPKYCLEEYDEINKNIFVFYPKNIFENIYIFDYMDYANYSMDFYIAFQVEQCNAKLNSIQHGGVYGIIKYGMGERFERHISNQFISWGWTGKNVLDMPSLLNLRWSKYIDHNIIRKDILFCTTVYERFPVGFAGSFSSLQPDKYTENIGVFLKSILADDQLKIKWRSYRSRLLYDDGSQVENVMRRLDQESLKRLSVDGNGSFISEANKHRLLVIDHCSTTLLETLSNNVPTILFWDRSMTILTIEAEEIFKKMENVGIFHSTPESAAIFIKNHYSEIEEWWQSINVQNVVNEFVERYARRDDDIILSYIKLFKTGKNECWNQEDTNIILYDKYKDLFYIIFLVRGYINKLMHKLKYCLVRICHRK